MEADALLHNTILKDVNHNAFRPHNIGVTVFPQLDHLIGFGRSILAALGLCGTVIVIKSTHRRGEIDHKILENIGVIPRLGSHTLHQIQAGLQAGKDRRTICCGGLRCGGSQLIGCNMGQECRGHILPFRLRGDAIDANRVAVKWRDGLAITAGQELCHTVNLDFQIGESHLPHGIVQRQTAGVLLVQQGSKTVDSQQAERQGKDTEDRNNSFKHSYSSPRVSFLTGVIMM